MGRHLDFKRSLTKITWPRISVTGFVSLGLDVISWFSVNLYANPYISGFLKSGAILTREAADLSTR